MSNDLFEIGTLTIHGYGTMIAFGLLIGYLLAERQAKRQGADTDALLNLFFACMVGCLIGAKLLYICVEWKMFLQNPLLIFDFENGFVIYGGLIGAMLGGKYYCRYAGISFLKYFEFFIPSLALAQGFGRIGCFLAGCCYGRETNSWFGIMYENSLIAPHHVKLIPTQLMSSGFDFLLAALLFYMAKKQPKRGMLLSVYLIVYSIGRFVIEFFRNDERGFIGMLSVSQWLAVGILIFTVYGIIRQRRGNHGKSST